LFFLILLMDPRALKAMDHGGGRVGRMRRLHRAEKRNGRRSTLRHGARRGGDCRGIGHDATSVWCRHLTELEQGIRLVSLE
jgi:hypothetical protein